jgi:hypothetical protein
MDTREAIFWSRSAERHESNNRTAKAILSRHLAHIAQSERDEYERTRQIAEMMHRSAQERIS